MNTVRKELAVGDHVTWTSNKKDYEGTILGFVPRGEEVSSYVNEIATERKNKNLPGFIKVGYRSDTNVFESSALIYISNINKGKRNGLYLRPIRDLTYLAKYGNIRSDNRSDLESLIDVVRNAELIEVETMQDREILSINIIVDLEGK